MPSPIVSIRTSLDPRHLQVNRRNKHSHWVPTETRKAMATLQAEARSQIETLGWTPARTTTYSVALSFVFPTMNSDVDGPVKRAVDAVFRGMREAVDRPEVNDARVVDLRATKATGEPGLELYVWEIDKEHPVQVSSQ